MPRVELRNYRKARTPFRRLQPPHVFQRRKAIAVRRQCRKGVLRHGDQCLRRQTSLEGAHRGGGRRRIGRRSDQDRHQVGGRLAHGRGNGRNALTDKIVQRRAQGNRANGEQQRDDRRQRQRHSDEKNAAQARPQTARRRHGRIRHG